MREKPGVWESHVDGQIIFFFFFFFLFTRHKGRFLFPVIRDSDAFSQPSGICVYLASTTEIDKIDPLKIIIQLKCYYNFSFRRK